MLFVIIGPMIYFESIQKYRFYQKVDISKNSGRNRSSIQDLVSERKQRHINLIFAVLKELVFIRSMAESQNRQILQDLQQKRQMLLNQGQAGAGNIGLVWLKFKLLR